MHGRPCEPLHPAPQHSYRHPSSLPSFSSLVWSLQLIAQNLFSSQGGLLGRLTLIAAVSDPGLLPLFDQVIHLQVSVLVFILVPVAGFTACSQLTARLGNPEFNILVVPAFVCLSSSQPPTSRVLARTSASSALPYSPPPF